MMVEPSLERQEAINRNRSSVVEQHNRRLFHSPDKMTGSIDNIMDSNKGKEAQGHTGTQNYSSHHSKMNSGSHTSLSQGRHSETHPEETKSSQGHQQKINQSPRTRETEVNTIDRDNKQNIGQERERSVDITTKWGEDVELEPRNNYPENLINQLKRMNIKQPTLTEGNVQYKSSEELEKQWDSSPHLTVIMDDDITERYIQDLLDKALLF
jgi:hypothetical protein